MTTPTFLPRVGVEEMLRFLESTPEFAQRNLLGAVRTHVRMIQICEEQLVLYESNPVLCPVTAETQIHTSLIHICIGEREKGIGMALNTLGNVIENVGNTIVKARRITLLLKAHLSLLLVACDNDLSRAAVQSKLDDAIRDELDMQRRYGIVVRDLGEINKTAGRLIKKL